jgi:Ax21 family sulfation-dependent quorum factor
MKKQLGLAIALAAASFAATAGELSYSYVEGGYLRTDINNLGDGDGFAVNGSVALNDSFHLFGGYSMQDASEDGVDVDLDAMRVGAGWNHALGERLDFVARAAYERSEADFSVPGFGSFNGETDGYSLEAGLRGLTSLDGNIEGWLMGGYADLNHVEFEGVSVETDEREDDEFYARVGGQVKFNATWGIVAEGMFAEDAHQLFLGVRASF